LKRLLGLVCGLLLTVIMAEVSFGSFNGQVHRRSKDAPHVADTAQKVMASDPRTLAEWQTIVLARPLFNTNRKPEASAAAASAGLPRLTGVVASPDDAVAIFQPAGNGRPLVVRHGETVGGWEVTTIADNTVSLRKEADLLVLRPAFGNAGSAKANEPEQPRTRWEAAAATGVLRARWSNPQLQP
jgi:hypothetical protein